MRSMFYILSDDHIGSTPLPAPGSMVQAHPDPAQLPPTEDDDVMEVSGPSDAPAPSALNQSKRKRGDLFSGTLKLQRTQSQS
jgi:hypothetical protein